MGTDYIILSVSTKSHKFLPHTDCFMAYLILEVEPLPSFILETKPLPSLIVVAKSLPWSVLMAKSMQIHVPIAMLLFIRLGLRASTQCPNLCHFSYYTLNHVYASEVNCVHANEVNYGHFQQSNHIVSTNNNVLTLWRPTPNFLSLKKL